MKYTVEQVATIVRGKAALSVTGKDMPDLDNQIYGLMQEGGYEKLSEQERYWVEKWFAAGVKYQQKEAKNMEKYLARPATIADVFAILGKAQQEMFGDKILEDPGFPNDKIELAISIVHTLVETLVEKGVVTKDELKDYQKRFKESVTDDPVKEDQPSGIVGPGGDALH